MVLLLLVNFCLFATHLRSWLAVVCRVTCGGDGSIAAWLVLLLPE